MFDHAARSDHSLLQDPAFAAALRRLGQHPLRLPNGQTLLSRRILGIRILMLPRATPPPDLSDQLSHLGLQRAPLILSPDTPCALPLAFRLRAPQSRAILDLAPDENTRRATLHCKWRNALRRAERSSLKVHHSHLPGDPNHPLLQAEVTQARSRGYANWPPALTAAFAREAPAQTHLFTATLGNRQVAHALFLRHGAQASYHIGQITPLGRTNAAHNLLIWAAMNRLRTLGCHSLDLGLIHSDTPGLTRFKCRTGATLRATGGTWQRWTPLASGNHP